MTGVLEYIDKKHVLTQDERNEMGLQLAEKQIEIQTLLEEKKGVVSSFTAKIDIKKAEINLAATQIKDGYITLTVHAERRRNFKEKCWEWVDPNTGEIVKTKPFEGSDFQMRVDDDVNDQQTPWSDPGVEDVEHSEFLSIGDGSEGDDTKKDSKKGRKGGTNK